MSERDPSGTWTPSARPRPPPPRPGAIGGRAPRTRTRRERPVSEAGGGESEGFELAEEQLVEHAEHGDGGPSPTRAAFPPEVESDEETAEHGEADSARRTDRAVSCS